MPLAFWRSCHGKRFEGGHLAGEHFGGTGGVQPGKAIFCGPLEPVFKKLPGFFDSDRLHLFDLSAFSK